MTGRKEPGEYIEHVGEWVDHGPEDSAPTEPVVLVRITIEPSWTIDHYDEVVEIPASVLAGLEGMARQEKITNWAEDIVNDVCSWGASEVAGPEDQE